jgi:hypothetical protein
MKNLSAQTVDHTANNPVSVYQLVSRLQANLQPRAVEKRSFIINDVDKNVHVTADENIFAFIISGLVSNAIFSTSDSCIRIETIYSENGIQLKIRNNSQFVYSTNMCSIGNIVDAAHKLGGSIGFQNESNKGFSVVLFMSASKAA